MSLFVLPRSVALSLLAIGALLSGSIASAKPPAAAVSAAPPAAAKGPSLPDNAPVLAPPVGGDGTAQSIGYLTATQLGAKCTDASTAGISYCYAFITGVHDSMQAYERWLQQKEFCPDMASQGELRKSFLAYLTAYPNSGQGQAASVVVVALKASYPCKAGQ